MNTYKPFRHWCHKVIPLIYDDSLSYYELLCKVIKYLNDVISDITEIDGEITEIKNAIEILQTYLDNLNITDEIDAKLDELVENGTLMDILLTKYFPPEIKTEYVSSWTALDPRYTANSSIEDKACVIQSFCDIGDGVFVACMSEPEGLNTYTNYGKLIKVNRETCLPLGSAVSAEIGHCNDICFDGTYIYVVWAYDYSGGSAAYSNKISKFDTNLNLISTYTPSVSQVGSLTYDPEGYFYGYGIGNNFYKFDTDFNVISTTSTGLTDYYKEAYYNTSGRFTVQTLTFINGYIFIPCVYPSSIFVLNTDGEVVKVFSMHESAQNGGDMREIEAIEYVDGYFYVTAFSRLGCGDIAINTFSRWSFTKGAVTNELSVNPTTRPFYHGTSKIYISDDVAANAKMLGTSQYPFRYIQQGIDLALKLEQDILIVVDDLDSAEYYGSVAVAGNSKSIRITSDSYSSGDPYPNASNNNYFIPEVKIYESVGVQFFFMNIEDADIHNATGLVLDASKIDDLIMARMLPAHLADCEITNATISNSTIQGYASNTFTNTPNLSAVYEPTLID